MLMQRWHGFNPYVLIGIMNSSVRISPIAGVGMRLLMKIPEKTVLNLFSNPAFSGITEQKQDFLFQSFPGQKPGKPGFLRR